MTLPKHILLNLLICTFFISSGFSQDKILVFTETIGWDHYTRDAAETAFSDILTQKGLTMDVTSTSTDFFTDQKLAEYQIVIFASTTGDVLDNTEQDAFIQFIQNGGGFLGIHAASDTEYNWEWYGSLVGAYFTTHALDGERLGTINVEDHTNPATGFLGDTWNISEEWYTFNVSPRANVNVLLSVDESSYVNYSGELGLSNIPLEMGDHPIAWCHDYDGGKSFYTVLGHNPNQYSNTAVIKHLSGAIDWLMGIETTLTNPVFVTMEQSNLIAYPNPLNEILNIEIANHNHKQYKLIVTNLEGKTLIDQLHQTNQAQIDLTGLAKGIYFVKIVLDSEIEIIKIIKH